MTEKLLTFYLELLIPNLLKDLNATNRSEVKRSNTNNTDITETRGCFDKPGRQEMAKLTAKYQNLFK